METLLRALPYYILTVAALGTMIVVSLSVLREMYPRRFLILGAGMLPLTALGYHTLPKAVLSCTLCHEQKNLGWAATHQQHRGEVSCSSCHTGEPTGLVRERSLLCSSCHSLKSWSGTETHKKHVEKQVRCATCHTFG